MSLFIGDLVVELGIMGLVNIFLLFCVKQIYQESGGPKELLN